MEKLIIIGSGSGGLPVASRVAELGRERYDITVVTKDPDIAYSPCGIPFVLKGDISSYEDLIMHPREHYRELGIKILTDTTVEEIDVKQKRIRYGSTWLSYDSLVIATGTSQRIPQVKGIGFEGVFSAHIKTLKDAQNFERYISAIKKPLKVVITGGASIDLEFAVGLKERGHVVTVVEKAGHLMPDMLDSDMAEYVHTYLQDMGIRIITKHEPFEIEGTGRIRSVNLGDLALPSDILLLGTDFIPEVTLAKSAGFDTDKYGISIDEKGRVLKKGKAVEGTYASGSCARVINIATGKHDFMYTGAASIQRSKVVSEQLLGLDAVMTGSANPRIAVLRDLHIGTAGVTSEKAEDCNIEIKTGFAEKKSTARYFPGGSSVYIKLLFEENTLRVIGAQIISRGYGIKERIDALSIALCCGATAKELAHLETAYSPPVAQIIDAVVEIADNVWLGRNKD